MSDAHSASSRPATEAEVSLGDAARIVARGGDLDEKLQALAAHARRAASARLAAILLLDDEARVLVPAAADGDLAGEPLPLEVSATHPAVARAISERRPERFVPDAATAESLPFLPADATSVVVVPLVTATDEGDAEVDGVLVAAGSGGEAPALGLGTVVADAVLAVADLAAVAIRQTRLENALHERVEWVERMANTDPLTGLANRRTFDQMLQLELARAARQGVPVGVSLFAVDDLEQVRSALGESAADDVLRRIAATLADQLRLVDTVARVGPDRFGAICPGSPGPEAARRSVDAIATLEAAPDGPARITVSAAVARFPQDGSDADALLAAAEAALDRAVAAGPGALEMTPSG